MISICNIICDKKTDCEILVSYLKNYPVSISDNIDNIKSHSTPTLITGWSLIKEQYPQQNIFNKQINNLVHWTYSHEEDGDSFLKETKKFVEQSLINWLPKDFIIYDHFLNGDIKEFIKRNLNEDKDNFIYYNDGAIYINNDDKNYIFNIKNILHFDINTKSELNELFNTCNSYILSYENVNDIIDINDFCGTNLESLFWVKYNIEIDERKLFDIIPNFEYKKYIPYFMNMILPKEELNEEEELFLKRMKERDYITLWLSNQEICITNKIKLPKEKEIKIVDNKNFTKINYSNKRTKTNRIVCKDSWNIQNEPKDSERRKEVISRFDGGRIMVCDFISFETKISLLLTRDVDFINKNKNKDLHLEVAGIIFKKINISASERNIAKNLNHSMLYGASQNKLKEILGANTENQEETLYYIQKFLEPIILNAKKVNEECNKKGYIITPWNSIIRPDKDYAAYNNLVQTIASEIIIDKMIEIKNFLSDKKSKMLFQIHDSMIFDISPDEKHVVKEILNILSTFKKFNFNINYKIGKNYQEFDLNKNYF